MTKSELIELLADEQAHHLVYRDVELTVRCILEQMSSTLAAGGRIEIRGFGSFCLHYRPPRIGRNPKTGGPVALAGKHVPHFKPGKELRDRVNAAFMAEQAQQQDQAAADQEASKAADTDGDT
ncbi:integration host factor subunit beta [Candidatus Thiosymbion oneisti]|uniref:integration host factor subunit beta n=1 Tax=Candidatus Thiosymbion oneisti TaxID=589554 RepID=UPI000A5C0E4A|nr:integration host factor subunit beta [Candidatus Thiosymbion oneisti]